MNNMTALQEALKRIEKRQHHYIGLAKQNKELRKNVDAILTATTLIIMELQPLLEKEKQQIIDAKNDKLYPIETGGKQYYRETYE